MCGRYITPTEADIERHWQLVPREGNPLVQHFNAAPSQLLPIIRLDKNGGQSLINAKWGFQPSWAKRAWINARAETAFTSKAFAPAAHKRRCLVPAIGWYEWQGSRAPKQPYCLHLDGFRVFAFAGIFNAEQVGTGWQLNFAILTGPAASYIEQIHDRMPVLVNPKDYDAWLSPDTKQPQELIRAPFQHVHSYRVSTLVNKPAVDQPEVMAPL